MHWIAGKSAWLRFPQMIFAIVLVPDGNAGYRMYSISRIRNQQQSRYGIARFGFIGQLLDPIALAAGKSPAAGVSADTARASADGSSMPTSVVSTKT